MIQSSAGKQNRRRRRRAAAVGPLDIWHCCQPIVGDAVEIETWKVGMFSLKLLKLLFHTWDSGIG